MSMSAAVLPLTHALRTVLTQLEVLCAVVPVATDLAVTASPVKVIGIQYTCRCSVDKCFDKNSCKLRHRSQKSS